MLLCCRSVPNYLLVIFIIILTTSGRGACLCHQDQSDALLRLKASFHFFPFRFCPLLASSSSSFQEQYNSPFFPGSFPRPLPLPFQTNLSSWQADTDCCTWEGVTCDDGTSGHSHVTALDLSCLGISGNLSLDIFKLTSLRSLNLAGNFFRGNNPWACPAAGSAQQQLSDLKYLNLSYSGLSGHFDVENGQLANLLTLDLSGLRLENLNLFTLIDNLGSLQELFLDHVNVSVSPNYSTPSSPSSSNNYTTTSGLKELSMMGCTMFGPFVSCSNTGRFDSAALARFANLVKLGLSGLDLGDLSLDTLVHTLGSLQKLYLVGVNISVVSPSPTGLVKTPLLQELLMSGCKITGPIDIFLAKLHFLSKLTLDNSDFVPTDRVLESFTNLSSLVVLSLQDCGLNGTFPSKIFHMKSLTILDVSFNKNLYGELPEFRQGSALQVLVLSGTKFFGPIPKSIGNLKNLSILDLYSCQFHGVIPSFAQWPEIMKVDLSSNNLTGFLPSDGYLGLGNLIYINLENNLVSGEIPASLFSNPHLQYLLLSQNNFTGNFLLYPNASQRLRMIDISKNKLQGPIPKLVSKLLGLEELDLSSNNFTGTVDLNLIKNYVNMTLLSLSNNRLSVVIMEDDDTNSYREYPRRLYFLGLASCNLTNVPEFLRHQKLLHLDLSNNNIAGHIPDWIWENGEYDAVNLSHNSFSSIQTDLSSLSMYGLFYLDLHSNKIEGALPLAPRLTEKLDYSNNHFNSSVTTEFWSHISSSSFVFLSNNSLVGEIPHLLCNGTYIEILDLSFNRFSGLIPPCFLKHKNKLEILKLRGNNFHGSVPQQISKECALQIIDINNNKLEGKLPASLVNCRMLQLLDLGNNEIVDTFPEWLGVLPLLKVLVLNDNRFNGHIDQYGRHKQMHSYFPALQVLDLSSNAFTGGIPTLILKKLKAMMVPSSSRSPSINTEIIADLDRSPPVYMPYDKSSFTITLKGQETSMVSILPIFMYLDLSNNNFDGTISDGIGDLKLLKGLNLSRNSFTGHIPPRIANMLQLESLDLSYNKLSGNIPPELALLTFLEVLNLSYNHLSGSIPQSNQFSTFPETSFLGNDGLCGKPLPHPCSMNQPPSTPAAPDSSTEVNWDVLGIEVGVISGLATVVVTTLVWGNGRRWVYYQVDRFFLRVLQPQVHHRRHRRH